MSCPPPRRPLAGGAGAGATSAAAVGGSVEAYIGAKAGNLPGDMTFSWYAVDRSGQPWVVSLQSNWPEFRSQTAAAWLMSIARQTFDLIPN